MESADNYFRLYVKGEIECKSPLHIGSGEQISISTRKDELHRDDRSAQSLYQPVVMGVSSNVGSPVPIIPAASIRGSLRGGREQRNEGAIGRLFGYANGDQLHAGKLQVFDARLKQSNQPKDDLTWSSARSTILHQGNTIDPITATAQEHHLFTFEQVPSESIFELEFVLNDVSKEDLQTFLGLLQQWDGTSNCSLGRGKTRGWGKVALRSKSVSIRMLTKDSLAKWCANPDDSLDKACVDLEAELNPLVLEPNGQLNQVGIWVESISPMLVNHPGRIKDKKTDDGIHPDLEFMRTTDGKAVIPGSTVRGVVRAHAQKILATIAHQYCQVPAEKSAKYIASMIDEIFGSTAHRSPIWFDEAIGTERAVVHAQSFSAVDRFTGGVADGALYTADAAIGSSLVTNCTVESSRMPDGSWWKGLLLFLLRDAMEEELSIGWGKAKGFGVIKAGITIEGRKLSSIDEVLNWLEERGENSERMISDLHKRIEEVVKQSVGEEK